MSKQLLMLGSMDEDRDEDELQPEYDISEDEEDEQKGDKEDGERNTSDSTHSKLMEAISSLDSKKKSKVKQRSEPTAEVSEFHLNKATDERGVKVHELVKTLKNTPAHSDIRKQLNNFQKKTPTLKTPLYKHEADKIQRTLAYQATTKDVSKWDEIVNSNRKAEHLSFPLNQGNVTLQSTNAFVKKFTATTKLEQEVYKLIKGSKHAEQKGKDLTEAEEDALKAMSLKEAHERRAELQKYRALQSYYEAKCRRQKKIKSRKYHRIQRKSKAKEETKKLAVMLENNPEEAQELLMKVEKSRAQERMSLKHKSTGKWAKGIVKFGKYNQEARDLLQEQLQKSRDLTEKIASANMNEDEDAKPAVSDEDDEEEDTLNPSLTTINNPWFEPNAKINKSKQNDTEDHNRDSSILFPTLEPVVAQNKDDFNVSSDSEDSDVDGDEIGSGLKKSEIDELINEKIKDRTSDNDDDDEWQELDDEEGIISEMTERRQTLEKLNEKWEDEDMADVSSKRTAKQSNAQVITLDENDKKKDKKEDDKKKDDKKKVPEHIDPNKVFTIQPKELNSLAPDLFEDEEMTEEEEQRMNIQQAFADDDVVDEFQDEKAKVVEEDKPKDIDLTLPGWGSWGGTGAKAPKKKKKFIIKAAPAKPRKDAGLGHVIINEKRDAKIAIHQVHDLPHTFKHTKQFERSIRTPIGPQWNTALTVKNLIVPKVTTKMGTIIDPISAADVFENKDTEKKREGGAPQRGGKRKQPDIMLDDGPQGKKRQRNKQKGQQKGKRNNKK